MERVERRRKKRGGSGVNMIIRYGGGKLTQKHCSSSSDDFFQRLASLSHPVCIGIIVKRRKIGLDVFPAAIVVDCSRGVEALRLVVETANVVSLSHVSSSQVISPAFVHQGPSDDGRVVDVSPHHRHPFLIEASHHVDAEIVATGHFTPDEEAEAVGPVEEAMAWGC